MAQPHRTTSVRSRTGERMQRNEAAHLQTVDPDPDPKQRRHSKAAKHVIAAQLLARGSPQADAPAAASQRCGEDAFKIIRPPSRLA